MGTALLAALLAHALYLVKLNGVVGSYAAHFSWGTSVMPTVGLFAPTAALLTWWAVKMLATGLFIGFSSASLALSSTIPTLFAALTLSTRNALVQYGLPLAAIILFVMHPTGSAAWPYALLWLIPLAIAATNQTALFWRALQSTFVAHAVGSVIWLYAVGMSSETWLMLMPIALLERILIAMGMVLFYRLVMLVQATISAAVRYLYKMVFVSA